MNIIVSADTAEAKASAEKAKATVNPPSIGVTIETASVSVDANAGLTVAFDPPVRTEYSGGEQYDGSYSVTPSTQAVTLNTRGKVLSADVVVAPIPSNYGLITWNGAFLTVS